MGLPPGPGRHEASRWAALRPGWAGTSRPPIQATRTREHEERPEVAPRGVLLVGRTRPPHLAAAMVRSATSTGKASGAAVW